MGRVWFLMHRVYRGNLAATSYKHFEQGCLGLKCSVMVRICPDAQFLPRRGVLLPFREAESFKEQGNAYYAKKDYNEAYNYYTKAIGENSWEYKLLLSTTSKTQSWLLIADIAAAFLTAHAGCRLFAWVGWRVGASRGDCSSSLFLLQPRYC